MADVLRRVTVTLAPATEVLSRPLKVTVLGSRTHKSFNDWGGQGCHNFVPVLGGDGTKMARTGDLLDHPPVK